MALKWHLPSPSALFAASHQGPRSSVSPVHGHFGHFNIRSAFHDMISFCQVYIFIASTFPPLLWDLGFLKAHLVNKDQGKGGIQYLSLFHVCASRSTVLLSHGTTFFLLLPMYFIYLLLYPLTFLPRFNSIWAFAFLISSCMLGQCLVISPRLSILASTFCVLPSVSESGESWGVSRRGQKNVVQALGKRRV